MIKVQCEVKVYEKVGGGDSSDSEPIFVDSHWNEDRKVYITIQGVKVVVVAQDLIAAINNCTNSGRF